MKYKISSHAKLNKVTYRTVWNWVKSGRLKTITARLYGQRRSKSNTEKLIKELNNEIS